MQHLTITGSPSSLTTECLVLAIHESADHPKPTQAVDEATQGYLLDACERAGVSGKRGESLLLLDVPAIKAERVLLIGCGDAKTLDARRFRKIAAHAARVMARCGASQITSTLPSLNVSGRGTRWLVKHLIECTEMSHYRYKGNKQSDSVATQSTPQCITWLIPKERDKARAERATDQAVAVASGMTLARDLGNQPPNVCTPSYIAKAAVELAEIYTSLKTHVLDESAMQELGMGALLAVSKGSIEPARFITIEHMQGPQDQAPIVIVGKGVTFDSGGISIKPAPGLENMRFDMCGAACVLGTMKACAALDLPVNVVGIVAAVENMPGGGAYRPGDVIQSMSGRTIEVLNTDAEGRLALCDALHYAKRFKPDIMIDVATLTGACVVALGRHAHGLFSNSRSLTRALETAGKRAHDRPWPMPLWDEYAGKLDTPFADIANMGGQSAGAISAACFLQRFVSSRTRWAHLDIAGTAWEGGSEPGATGRPVPLLTQFLIDHVESRTR